MKHQFSAALHFKHLVRQIPRAVLLNESNRLLQTFPLRFPIQTGFTERNHPGMQLTPFGKLDKITDIHRHNNPALRIGIAPDLNVGLTLKANVHGGTGFQTLLVRPSGKLR